MTNFITLELDIAHDYYYTPEYNHDLARFNVGDKLIALEGPAGGNPLVHIRGTLTDLESLLTHWEYDAEDIDDLLDGAIFECDN
jgi:hypothetical protein